MLAIFCQVGPSVAETSFHDDAAADVLAVSSTRSICPYCTKPSGRRSRESGYRGSPMRVVEGTENVE
jgi:hypothetical protein